MVSFSVVICIFKIKSNVKCSLFLVESSGPAVLDKLARRRWVWTLTSGTLMGLEEGRRFQLVRFLFCFPFSICSSSMIEVLVFTAASVQGLGSGNLISQRYDSRVLDDQWPKTRTYRSYGFLRKIQTQMSLLIHPVSNVFAVTGAGCSKCCTELVTIIVASDTSDGQVLQLLRQRTGEELR